MEFIRGLGWWVVVDEDGQTSKRVVMGISSSCCGTPTAVDLLCQLVGWFYILAVLLIVPLSVWVRVVVGCWPVGALKWNIGKTRIESRIASGVRFADIKSITFPVVYFEFQSLSRDGEWVCAVTEIHFMSIDEERNLPPSMPCVIVIGISYNRIPFHLITVLAVWRIINENRSDCNL